MEDVRRRVSLKDRLGEIYDEAMKFGADAIVFQDRNGDFQMSQSDIQDRFKSRASFVEHMAGTDRIKPFAVGYLRNKVISMGLMYREKKDSREVYQVVLDW